MKEKTEQERTAGEKSDMGKAYIWDLDGTLLDSYGVIVSSLLAAAAGFGWQEREEDVLRVAKREAVSAYIRRRTEGSGVSYEAFWTEYRRCCAERNDGITLIPEARETLEALQEQGGRHFVYTHRGASSHPILRRLGILDFFEEVVTHENGFPGKPAPDGNLYLVRKYGLKPEETWYVGDRQLDVLSADNAGICSALYLEEGSCVEPTGRETRIIHRLSELTEA